MKFNVAIVLCVCALGAHGAQVFDVFALEKGKVVHETVEPDPEQQLLRIHMPAHNGLDNTNTLVDYKKGLFVRQFPDRQRCVVGVVKDDQFSQPDLLQDGLKQQQGSLWVNTPNITVAYKLGEEVDSQILSKEMLDLCRDQPVTWIREVEAKKMRVQDGITFYKDKKHDRSKRGIVFSRCREKEMACALFNNYCHYVQICRKEFVEGTQVSRCDAKEHLYGRNDCCRPCCMEADRSRSDNNYPDCELVQISDLYPGKSKNGCKQIISGRNLCKPNPCPNGKKCVHGIGRYICI